MDEPVCSRLLKEHDIKPTANRILILKALAAEDRHPLSLKELEEVILTIDKSNISRTLALFKEQHLVHDIEDGTGSMRYELCWSHDVNGEDDDMHVHFYCKECHRTICLFDTPIPAVGLPRGYEMESANYLIKGICPVCRRKKLKF